MFFQKIRVLIILSFFAATALVATVSLADTQSDTVPTSELYVSFLVDMTTGMGSTDSEVLAFLLRQTTVNGNTQYENLTISPDEVITMSVGQTSVVFDPNNDSYNRLPYVADGTYTLTFKRFNGEIYTSQAVMPEPISISAPASNTLFKKTDKVDISWNTVPADLFLTVLVTINCATTTGDLIYGPGTAEIPANFVSSCAGSIPEYFDSTYIKLGTSFSTLQGGFATASSAMVKFSYGDGLDSRPVTLSSLGISKAIAHAMGGGNNIVHLLR